MNNRRFTFYAMATWMMIVFTGIDISAQSGNTSVLTGGLRTPTRAIISPKGNVLVAEAGNGPNTGRISIIDPATGARRTLVDGLPSGFAPPEGDASGPSGLAMRGRTLFVVIGAGDGTVAGPVPGTEVPNANASSPFLSCVLSIRLSPLAEDTTQGFTISAADQSALGFKKLSDGAGNELLIQLVTNFPNFSEEPVPGLPTAVRSSNPFGIAIRGNILYVADASQNLVWEVDSDTGSTRQFVTFAARPNPLPFGPPFIDAVPDNVRLVGKSLLVTFLNGFPFPQGASEVRKIRLVNTASEPFIGGLTSAIDVLPSTDAAGQDQFFTLEFSTDMLNNGPGRLTRFDAFGVSRTVLVDNLITPTGLAQNPTTGDVYVIETFPGLIIRVKTN